MKNKELRMEMFKNNLKVWQVANSVGIDPATLSRWMREELEGDRLARVEKAVEKLKAEKKAGESV